MRRNKARWTRKNNPRPDRKTLGTTGSNPLRLPESPFRLTFADGTHVPTGAERLRLTTDAENPFSVLRDIDTDAVSNGNIDLSDVYLNSRIFIADLLDSIRKSQQETGATQETLNEIPEGLRASPQQPSIPTPYKKPRFLLTPGGTSTLPPNLFSSPGVSSCLPTIATAQMVGNPSGSSPSKQAGSGVREGRGRRSRFFPTPPPSEPRSSGPPTPRSAGRTAPVFDFRCNPYLDKKDGERDVPTSPPVPADGKEHKLDVTGFLKLGHARDCWCGREDACPEAQSQDLEDDGWVVRMADLKIQPPGIASPSLTPNGDGDLDSPSSTMSEWTSVSTVDTEVDTNQDTDSPVLC